MEVDLGQGKRFMIAPKYLGFGPNLVVLSDYNFWGEHYEELIEWCKEHSGVVEGMTVNFSSADDVMLFALRWS